MTVDDLLKMSRHGLTEILRNGHPIDPAALDDMEYKGVSLGLPGFIERLSWKTFKKVFHRDPSTGLLRGWNVRIQQEGVGAERYEPMTEGGEPKTFGHYRVVQGGTYRSPIPCPSALMIDYGLGGNGQLDPMRFMRDPFVAVNAGSADLLLGWSYVDLGAFQIGTPSFFSLERDITLSHVHDPPE